MTRPTTKGRLNAIAAPPRAERTRDKGKVASQPSDAAKALEMLTLREEDWGGKSEARIRAEIAVSPTALGASVARLFARGPDAGTDLTETVAVIRDRVQAVKANDLTGADEMLTAQAATMDAMFYNLAGKAAANLGSNLAVSEIYMRLALKTQSQCRATWETVAAIKNPPIVYAKQANFSGGGPQQVNNGAQVEAESRQIKQLGKQDVEWMDAGTPSAAGGIDPWLATVGAIHRASNSGGKGSGQPERVSRITESVGASDAGRAARPSAGSRRAAPR